MSLLSSFIRREKKFDSFEALTTQIASDAALARQMLSQADRSRPE